MKDFFRKAKTLIPGGVNSPVRAFKSVGGVPFYVDRADGAYLKTVDGRELIDFVCSWGAIIHGHNSLEIREAVIQSLERGTGFGAPHEKELEMAELIRKHYPSMKKVRMVNSGTEATMSAIRLARGFTNRSKILKFSGCYHGHADSFLIKAGSGAMTFGCPDSLGVPASFVNETIVIPFNNEVVLAQTIERFSDELACIIVEPYPANCGLILPKPGFLKKIEVLAKKFKILLVFDEVITGFRVSLGGAQALEDIQPDLTTLGKIIGGGLPIGAFGGREDVMDFLAPEGPVYQAGTLSGNPICLAAGIAAIKLLEANPSIYDQIERRVEFLKKSLSQTAKEKGIPLQIPHKKTLFSLSFSDKPIENYETALSISTDLFSKVFHSSLNNGLFLAPSPFECCFLSASHTDPIIAKAADILSKSLE